MAVLLAGIVGCEGLAGYGKDRELLGGDGSGGSDGVACTVDLVTELHDCHGPILVQALGDAKAKVRADLSRYSELWVQVEVTDPSGFVLDIGDSPCCDGGGGDCRRYARDAEFDVIEVVGVNQRDFPLVLHGSDYVDGRAHTAENGFFDAEGSSVRSLTIANEVLVLDTGERFESEGLIGINAPDDEGRPDPYVYLAFNRVIFDDLAQIRTGSGVTAVRLELR